MRTSWTEVISAHIIIADDPAREASAVRLRSTPLSVSLKAAPHQGVPEPSVDALFHERSG